MKQSCLIRPALLAAFLPFLPALHAAIPVNGTTTYTQNFDTLPTAAALTEFSWTDDTTLQGFYLHRSNAPATTNNLAGALTATGSRPYIADGSVLANTTPNHHGFLSLGAFGSTERSLGSCPTTNDGGTNWAGGTLSTIALFTNTGTSTVDLTDVAFSLDVPQANNDATVSETIAVTYKRGTAAALIAELQTYSANAAFQGTGYTTVDSALDHTAVDGFVSVAGTSILKSAALAAPVRVAPGQSVILRWSNTNDGGTDAIVGIDDLSVTFTELNSSIVPAVSNVVRNPGLTPLDPTDDTISFTLNAQGLGFVSGGWKITTPAAFAATGNYGTAQTISGVPIAEFAAAPHTATVTIEDAVVAGVSETFTVTAPWCAITGSAGAFVYNEGGTPDDASDDTVSYQISASGTFTGAEYTATPVAGQIAYGNSGSVTDVTPAPATPNFSYLHTFTDVTDPACTATLRVVPPQIIGVNELSGAPVNLKSVADFTDRRWTIDGTARTATQVSATQADHTILSETIDLSSIGWVIVTAELDAIAGTDTITANSSGFEALDHFLLDVIVDGGAPQSILGAGDVNGNGQLDGAAGIGTELPGAGEALVDTAKVLKSYSFRAFIPPAANSLQVRAIGNSNSGNETFIFKNLRIVAAQPSLQAVPGSGVVFNNKGTVDPSDDTVDMPVAITPINLGASTGWTSNLTAPNSPSAKNYTEPNPVTFSVAATTTPRLVTLKDVLDDTKTASFTVPALTRTFTATLAATPNIVRNENNPGVADDTVSFDITVTGANGGPQFALATEPGTVTSPSYAITSTGNTVRVTISAVPALGGTVYLRIWDESYPVAPMVNLAVAVPAPAELPTQYVIGKKDLGAGLTDVLGLPDDVPAAWQNYPSLPALFMINGGASTILTSEEINLSAAGAIEFTARLRGIDTSSGFEAADLFSAVLIIDGDTVNPVHTTDASDLDDPRDGLEGAEIAGAGGTFSLPTVVTHNLRYVIPATANTVQLVITGFTNSTNEALLLDQVLFQPYVGPVDTDNDGIPDAYENANGLNAGSNADRDTDLDGDGQSNYNEYLAGTAANDNSSTLQIQTIQPNGTQDQFEVTFTTVAGKKYRLQESTDLGAADTWTNIPGIVTGTGIPATLTATLPGPGMHFVRAVIVP